MTGMPYHAGYSKGNMPRVKYINDDINMPVVIERRKGKYLQDCPNCKLMLGDLDTQKTKLVCPRCAAVMPAPIVKPIPKKKRKVTK